MSGVEVSVLPSYAPGGDRNAIKEAVALQEKLRSRVIAEDDIGEVHCIAGIDCGLRQQGQITRAAIAVVSWPESRLIDRAIAEIPTRFPYVPGLLSFRELPGILAAWRKLSRLPDLILCDGQGYAHPRRFGVACHLGVAVGVPTVGIGKSRLLGTHLPLAEAKGSTADLADSGEIIGTVVRTRASAKPIYVSIGHRISLESAVAWAFQTTTRYRLPEPIRHAHKLASG